MRRFNQRTFHVLIALLAVPVIARADDPIVGNDSLVRLKSGKTDLVDYGIYQVGKTKDNVCDFLLILRNTGAKFIDGVDSTGKFALQDANGQDIKIALRSFPDKLAYQEVGVAHFVVLRPGAPTPWRLQYKFGQRATLPLELDIGDIKPIVMNVPLR